MIENKELPSEYVSIRQVWLQGINDCRKAISQVANIEATSERKEWSLAGPRTVAHTVDALYLSLVDYGEALVKTDVEEWKEKYYYPKHEEIWKKGRQSTSDEDDEPRGLEKWWAQFKLSRELYEEIIKVLNKYGMLFPEQPKGYTNVEMKSVE